VKDAQQKKHSFSSKQFCESTLFPASKNTGASIKGLAEKHQRIVNSMNSRLMRHGRMMLTLESQANDRQPSTEEGTEDFECPW
jgi:hypothetical protein